MRAFTARAVHCAHLVGLQCLTGFVLCDVAAVVAIDCCVCAQLCLVSTGREWRDSDRENCEMYLVEALAGHAPTLHMRVLCDARPLDVYIF